MALGMRGSCAALRRCVRWCSAANVTYALLCTEHLPPLWTGAPHPGRATDGMCAFAHDRTAAVPCYAGWFYSTIVHAPPWAAVVRVVLLGPERVNNKYGTDHRYVHLTGICNAHDVSVRL